MAQIAYIDHISMLKAVERRGVLVSMIRKALVMFREKVPSDYKILSNALNALPELKPITGADDFVPMEQPYQNLVLVDREVERHSDDIASVDVILRYEHILAGANQHLRGANRGILYVKGKSSIAQKPTNFYEIGTLFPQPGKVSTLSPVLSQALLQMTYLNHGMSVGMQVLVEWDGQEPTLGTVLSVTGLGVEVVLAGGVAFPIVGTAVFVRQLSGVSTRQQIVCGHSFPYHDPAISGLIIYPGYPNTEIQTGEVSVPFPQQNITVEGILQIDNPQVVVDGILRTINAVPWMNKPANTWICSEATYECLDTGSGLNFAQAGPLSVIKPTYQFSFQFQYDRDGWNPEVVFQDKRTGRPPANILPATERDANGILNQTRNPFTGALQPAGYWRVPVLTPVNFNEFFQAFFENGDAPPQIR